MSKQAFRIEGDFQMGRIRQHFTVECVSENGEDGAREQVLTNLGSRHGVKRREVDIQSVTAIKPDELTDPIIRAKI